MPKVLAHTVPQMVTHKRATQSAEVRESYKARRTGKRTKERLVWHCESGKGLQLLSSPYHRRIAATIVVWAQALPQTYHTFKI